MNVNGLVMQFFRLPKPLIHKNKISADELKKLFPYRCKVFTADSSFKLYELKSVAELLKLNYFAKMKYIANDRDCDDYEKVMTGLMTPLLPNGAFGKCWMDVLHTDGSLNYRHAVNVFVDEHKCVWLVEPQANKIFSYNTKKYKPYLVVI